MHLPFSDMAAYNSKNVTLKVTKQHDFFHDCFTQFQVMKDEEYLTDFLLKVDGKPIACHKVTLAAHSAYFHKMFTHKDSLEVSQGFVEFETLDFPALQSVVDYFYSGTLECNMEEAKHVIEVAEYLQISDLKTDLSALIRNHLTAGNCIGWYFFANLYGMTRVQLKAQKIMTEDFSDVICTPDFTELDYNDLCVVRQSSELRKYQISQSEIPSG